MESVTRSLFFLIYYIFKEDIFMWKILSTIATIGCAAFGLLGFRCDAKESKDKVEDLISSK